MFYQQELQTIKNRIIQYEKDNHNWSEKAIAIDLSEDCDSVWVTLKNKKELLDSLFDHGLSKDKIHKALHHSNFDPLVVVTTKLKLFKEGILIAVCNVSNLNYKNCFQESVINVKN